MPDWLLLIIVLLAIVGACQSASERHRHTKRNHLK